MSSTSTGRRRRGRPASCRVAPSYVSLASSSPETMSGGTPSRSRTPSTNSLRFETSRAAEVATNRVRSTRVLGDDQPVVVQTANVRRSASGANAPVLSTSCPSRTIIVRRSSVTRRAGRGVEVGDEQAQGVRPAVECRDPGHETPTASSSAAEPVHGPFDHHFGSSSSASSPKGLTPGPAASACATSACRHFTRVGIPPAEVAAISGTSPWAARVGAGSPVGPLVAEPQVGIGGEPAGSSRPSARPPRACRSPMRPADR